MTEPKVEIVPIKNHEKMRTSDLHRHESLDSNDKCEDERQIIQQVKHDVSMLLTARDWKSD